MQVLRDVVAAGAGADHHHVAALPRCRVAVLARMHHRAAEGFEDRQLGHVGNAAHAGRHHHMARPQGAAAAIGQAQGHGPTPGGIVVQPTDKFGAGPKIQFEALDIGLEPIGQLVFRDVGGPAGRKRQVGQVVDLHLVVQRECVVSAAPVVADARFAVDDQRVDIQMAQARGNRQAGMPATHHQHLGVVIRIGDRSAAFVEPVRPLKFA